MNARALIATFISLAACAPEETAHGVDVPENQALLKYLHGLVLFSDLRNCLLRVCMSGSDLLAAAGQRLYFGTESAQIELRSLGSLRIRRHFDQQLAAVF